MKKNMLDKKTNKDKVRAGILGAKATHKKRYEMIVELSKLVSKDDLNWISVKWKTTHIQKLLEAYKHG